MARLNNFQWVLNSFFSLFFSAIGSTSTHSTLLSGFVKGAEVNIDTKRNQLITAIETELESDITRGGYALDTEVISVETDEGTLFPIGGIRMTIRCIYTFESGTP